MEVNIDIVLRHNYWVAPVEKRRCFVDQVLHNNWVRQHNWLVLMVKLLSSAFRKCDFAISFSSYVSWYWTLVGRPNPFPVHLCTEKKNCQILVSCKINCLVKENGRTKKNKRPQGWYSKLSLLWSRLKYYPYATLHLVHFVHFLRAHAPLP